MTEEFLVMSVSPSDRSLVNRINALSRWSKEDGRAGTAKARASGPGSVEYWLAKVDPEGVLPEAERFRRAERAKKAHFLKLSRASALARARRSGGDAA